MSVGTGLFCLGFFLMFGAVAVGMGLRDLGNGIGRLGNFKEMREFLTHLRKHQR